MRALSGLATYAKPRGSRAKSSQAMLELISVALPAEEPFERSYL